MRKVKMTTVFYRLSDGEHVSEAEMIRDPASVGSISYDADSEIYWEDGEMKARMKEV